MHSTGIRVLDELLNGWLPQGALSEFVGPECSSRTSIASLISCAHDPRGEGVCMD